VVTDFSFNIPLTILFGAVSSRYDALSGLGSLGFRIIGSLKLTLLFNFMGSGWVALWYDIAMGVLSCFLGRGIRV